MIWDIHFADGTTIRATGKTFLSARITSQAQRVMCGEIAEQQLAVLSGTPVQCPASAIAELMRNPDVCIDPSRSGLDETAIEVRIPDESTSWHFDKTEVADLCEVIVKAIKSPGPVRILIRKGDEA